MMTRLCKAVMERFASLQGGQPNPFNAAVSGRLYFGEAPEGCPTPYAVFTVPHNVPDAFFENFRVRFDIYDWSTDATAVLSAGEALAALFDWFTPAGLGDPENLGFIRQGCGHLQDGQAQRYTAEYLINAERGIL